jgi:PAS domain S-box-containing protein
MQAAVGCSLDINVLVALTLLDCAPGIGRLMTAAVRYRNKMCPGGRPVSGPEIGAAVVHSRAEVFQDTLLGGGECGHLVASKDWSSSALGPLEEWAASLRTATSAFAGKRHPGLLGSKVREGWPEVAAFNDYVVRVGLAGGTLAYRDQELTLYRSGHPEQVWMNLDYSPVLDESGEPTGVLCVLAETTARVSAERDLRAERDQLKGVLDSVAEGFVLLDSDFRVLDINAAGLRMDGRPRETLLGRSHWEAFPASVGTPVEAAYRRAMAERVPVELEHRYVDPVAGYDIWLDIRAYPSEDGLALIYRDISGRKRDEAALRRRSDQRKAPAEVAQGERNS